VSRDERTYGKIRQKFDEWVDLEATRPERAYLRRKDTVTPNQPRGNPEISRTIHTLFGAGIGTLLLGLAFYAFATAAYWASHGRDGAQVGYTLAGVFLLIAGAGGIIATVNHNFRVITRPPPPHH
jgi:hypothetical protein